MITTAALQQACTRMRLDDDPRWQPVADWIAAVAADSELRDPHQEPWEQAMRMGGGQYKHASDVAEAYMADTHHQREDRLTVAMMSEYESAGSGEDRRPGLHDAVSQASEQMAKLQSQLKELSQRLAPVLLPETPTPPALGVEVQAKADTRSPVVGQIQSHVADIRSAQSRVASLLNRLEA